MGLVVLVQLIYLYDLCYMLKVFEASYTRYTL
jgi:hypothetical protein